MKASLALMILGLALTAHAQTPPNDETGPFLEVATVSYGNGDFHAALDLCEEILKREPNHPAARDLASRANRQLEKLTEEAFVSGRLLESLNRVEEAKQYYWRASNFSRPGSPRYQEIREKIQRY